MHYRVLGPLAPTSASVQQRLLLCYLLIHANRSVPSTRLIEELWAPDQPVDPAAALRTQVSRLRRRLPADALVTEPGGYRLVVADDDLDSAVFEQLLEQDQVQPALALWRGGAYEEFADRPFAQVEAARLEQMRLDAEERHARLLLSRGDATAAAGVAETLLARRPDRESARAVLMEALYRSGQQTAALETYQSWRRELRGDHGLDPTPELSRLQQDILRQHMPTVTPPRPLDSFLGRDDDVADASALLRSARLLTLTGLGGVGKTRLAIEVAHAVASSFADGVVFCELTSVSAPDAVPRAVAWALGMTEVGGSQVEDALLSHLRARKMLLVLDGCEHVLDSAAALTSDLIHHTDGVTVLATSRERLAVKGEQVRSVATLRPDAAIRLFRDRAREVNAGFADTDDDVARVCARLDGLPLAIELAAARVGSLRAEQMVEALDDRFSVLADRRRSLAATLQWSYDLLSASEQDALCRLAAFAGSFDREAAAALGVDIGVLLRLADRSLVDGANPYRLLDSVRDYARQQLREHHSLDLVARLHAEWAVRFASAAAAGLSTVDEPIWAQGLALHFAELRAAHQWLVEHDPNRAVEIIVSLRAWALWRANAEVFDWAETVAAATSHPAALGAAATGAWQRGDLRRAVALATEAMPHRWAVETLGEVAFLRGKLPEAQQRYLHAAQLAHAANDGLQEVWCAGTVTLAAVYSGGDTGDDPDALLARADSLGSPSARAMACFVAGEARGEVTPLLDAIQLADSVGSRFIAGLARTAVASLHGSADPITALEHYADVITQWRDSEAWTAYWVTLRNLIVLLARLGHHDHAAVLYGADQAAAHGAPAYGREAALLETTAMDLKATLGAETFAARLEQGLSLSEEASASYALQAVSSARTQLKTSAP